ncbi:MAG: phosphatase PAP2/dual specificity phosphatase family protein [Acidobacteriota bacterium]
MTGPRPWKAAALWLAFLGPFFFASYGFANWLASRRVDVGSVVFGWERHIPFLAWTIVPYWSIDLLYAGSLFVCATRQELSAHARRLLAAQLVCVACFLAFPLRFSFSRPPAIEGAFGAMFTALVSFDKPFNQAPSLHIALLILLWVRYAAHLGRAGRALLHVWFALIGISVLTTWQHHFIDVPTGLWAGLFCLWLIPENARTGAAHLSREPKRLRLAVAYLIPGAALSVAGPVLGGWGWLLLWPGGALVLVAMIYLLGDASLFRKEDGRIPAPAFWLLFPYLAGAWINSRLWTRRKPAPAEIGGGVLLGRIPTRRERQAARARSLVDLAAELPVDREGVAYRAAPMLDLLPPTVEQIDDAVAAVEELAAERPTLLFCALGYGRGAIVSAACLMASGRAASVDEAISGVRRARPEVVFTPAHRQRLEEWRSQRKDWTAWRASTI